MKIIHAFFMCLGMFSAIPCPSKLWDENSRALMTACLPVVGAVLGALWFLFALLGRAFLPAGLSAAWIAALPFLLTGFMHLDGYMDSTDALLSWRPLEERQKILKDVHCGSFSVVSLALLMMAMYAAAGDLKSSMLKVLIFIPVASRCMSAFCVTALKPIGHSEYAKFNRGAATPLTAIVILILALLISGLWLGWTAPVCLLATAAGYACAMAWAVHTLKGVSGDLAGYSLCIGELCGLISAALF